MKWLEFCLQAPIKSLYLRGWKSEIKGIFHYPKGKAGDDDIYILDIVKSGGLSELLLGKVGIETKPPQMLI